MVVLCDPVMGDIDYGLYVATEVADALVSHLVHRADILTPNLFEARQLTALPYGDEEEVMMALLTKGASINAVTGVETNKSLIRTLAGDRNGIWVAETPHVQLRPTGTGDIFSARFLFEYLESRSTQKALRIGVEAAFHSIRSCFKAGSKEIATWHLPPAHAECPSLFDLNELGVFPESGEYLGQ